MSELVERIIDLELGRFSVNDYRGLLDAPPFCLVEGMVPVVISAPHAVSQWRDGKVKASDDFTGALALVAAELAGCHALVASRFDGCDPNWDAFETCRYKQELVRFARSHGVVAVLDVHGVPSASPFAIEIGSADGETVRAQPGADERAQTFLREELAPFLAKHGKAIALNENHAARNPNTVTRTVARECGIVALQLEVSTPFRVPTGRGSHLPKGEALPFTAEQLPRERACRSNPDPACVEATARALAHLAAQLAQK